MSGLQVCTTVVACSPERGHTPYRAILHIQYVHNPGGTEVTSLGYTSTLWDTPEDDNHLVDSGMLCMKQRLKGQAQ